MSPLQKQMRDAMVLRGLAARTQQAYVFAVVRLAQHYRRSPDCLSADEVRQFLLVLLNERHRARSTVNQYSCAYRFLYGTVLGRADADVQIPLGKLEQKLPEILSRAELARLFALTRREKARTFLQLASERVNDFATPMLINLLRKCVSFSGRDSPWVWAGLSMPQLADVAVVACDL